MKTMVGPASVESLVVSVTELVAEMESCDSLALPPLHESIDMGALQSLCEHSKTATDRGAVAVSFRYSDSVVHVSNDETLTITAVPADTVDSLSPRFDD